MKQIRSSKLRISSIVSANGQGEQGNPYSDRAYNYDADKALLRTCFAYGFLCTLACFEIRRIRKNPESPAAHIVYKILDAADVSKAARNFGAILWDPNSEANFCELSSDERSKLYAGFTGALGDNWEERFFAPLIRDDKSLATEFTSGPVRIPAAFNLWKGKKPSPRFVSTEDNGDIIIDIYAAADNEKLPRKPRDKKEQTRHDNEIFKRLSGVYNRLQQLFDEDVIGLCNSGQKGHLITMPTSLFGSNGSDWNRATVQRAFSYHNLLAEKEQKALLQAAKDFVAAADKAFADDLSWQVLNAFEQENYKLYERGEIKRFLKERQSLLENKISIEDLEDDFSYEFYALLKNNPGIWMEDFTVNDQTGCLLYLRCKYNDARSVKGKQFTYPVPLLHPLCPSFVDGGDSAQLKCTFNTDKAPYHIDLKLMDVNGIFKSFTFLIGNNERFKKSDDFLQMLFGGVWFDVSKISFRPEIGRKMREYIFDRLSADMRKQLSNLDLLLLGLKKNPKELINKLTDEVFDIVQRSRTQGKWVPFYLTAGTTIKPKKHDKNADKITIGFDLNMGDNDHWATVNAKDDLLDDGSVSIAEEATENEKLEHKSRKDQIYDLRSTLRFAQQMRDLGKASDKQEIKAKENKCRRTIDRISDEALRNELAGLWSNLAGIDAVACRLYDQYKKSALHTVVNGKVRHQFHGGESLETVRMLELERNLVTAFHTRTQPNGVKYKSVKRNGRYQRLQRKVANVRLDVARKAAAANTAIIVKVGAYDTVLEDLKWATNSSAAPTWSNRNNTNWRKRKIVEQMKNNLALHNVSCFEGQAVDTSMVHN